jgi:hypothetical protein
MASGGIIDDGRSTAYWAGLHIHLKIRPETNFGKAESERQPGSAVGQPFLLNVAHQPQLSYI